jgi:riboflavin synthase
MFTGIIETIGTVEQVRRQAKSLRLGIRPSASDYTTAIGGSVAIDGACLTLESRSGGMLFFTAVFETLRRTTLANVEAGRRVNMERALRISDRLDGHLVLGHIDGIGAIVGQRRIGDSVIRTIAIPEELRGYMAPKGSVALDGLSLTIAAATRDTIDISFIPHTLAVTTTLEKKTGDPVNLECDILARYTARLLAVGGNSQPDDTSDSRLMNLLERMQS